MQNYETVEQFIDHYIVWEKELQLLRSILLKTELDESIKWAMPAYSWNKKNIVGIGAFKSYVGLWFHQGVFLKDGSKVLMNAQENRTKAMRQWRFAHISDINEKLILEYVAEAIQNQKDGKEIKPLRNTSPVIIPIELEEIFISNPHIRIKFESFTTSNKREFADYISNAKRLATKEKRLNKIIPMIESGSGLNDMYKTK